MNKIKNLFFVASILLILFLIAGCSKNLVYSSPQNNFTLKYPSSWKVKDGINNDIIIKSPTSEASLGVKVSPLPTQGYTIQELGNLLIDQIKNAPYSPPNFKIISHEYKTIKDNPGFVLETSSTINNVAIKQTLYNFINNNKLYTVGLTYHDNEKPSVIDDLSKIFESMQLN